MIAYCILKDILIWIILLEIYAYGIFKGFVADLLEFLPRILKDFWKISKIFGNFFEGFQILKFLGAFKIISVFESDFYIKINN